MSVNRSVQAAQRRRAGPTNVPEPPRGPATSINSAQMFANQARPGSGPNIPQGRLAAQQVSRNYAQPPMQPQQMQAQQMQQGQVQDNGFSKMTIAQAITLITLRLGKVEQSLIDIECGVTPHSFSESSGSLDKDTLNTIISRIESLERRPASNSVPEVNALKHQLEAIKPTIAQSKTSTVSLAKENKELKDQVNALKNELSELKETLFGRIDALEMSLTMDDIDMGNASVEERLVMEEEQDEEDEQDEEEGDEGDKHHDYDAETFEEHVEDIVNNIPLENLTIPTNEIIGTDLKQMIEQELNSVSMSDDIALETTEVETMKQSNDIVRTSSSKKHKRR
jgi:hypothetical protein